MKTLGRVALAAALSIAPVLAHAQDALLWRIEGAAKPSFLFGTIHLGDPRVTELKPIVRQALAVTESLYTEVPLGNANILEQASRLMLPPDEDLESLVGAELVGRVDRFLRSINPVLTIEPFRRLKVWALATTLTLVERQLTSSGALPMDVMLYQEAVRAGIEVGGLETMDEQIGIFDNMSGEAQHKLLVDTLEFLEENREQGKDFTEEFIELYAAGDLEALAAVMTKYLKDDAMHQELMDSLLYRRNEIMAQRIGKILDERGDRHHFFAVGAGHLWGEQGIVALLGESGLEVVRLR